MYFYLQFGKKKKKKKPKEIYIRYETIRGAASCPGAVKRAVAMSEGGDSPSLIVGLVF